MLWLKLRQFNAQNVANNIFNYHLQVDRSIALLKSLVIERERWEASSETFRSQMSTIVGDVLLSAAFIAYGGYFDQHVSHRLVVKNNLQNVQSRYSPVWKNLNIKYI